MTTFIRTFLRRTGLVLPAVWILTALVNPSNAQPAADTWKAGVARVVVTPPELMWMEGYSSRDRPAEGKIQDLWLKVLALEDAAGHRAVLVTSDLHGFPQKLSDAIRDRLERAYRLPREQVMLTGSHTHAGPAMNERRYHLHDLDRNDAERAKVERYTRFLEERVVEAVARALDELTPARLSSGTGVTRFAVNRRNNTEAEVLTRTETAGPSDHTVPVLKVERADGQLLAVVFGYACHATTLTGNNFRWSGDYPGFAQAALEEAHPGTTALFFAGAGADQNPSPRGTVALARQHGRALAAAVDRVLQEPMQHLAPDLQTRYAEIDLSFTTLPTRSELRAVMDRHANYQRDWAMRQLAMMDRGERRMTHYPYPVQVWQLGDQTLVALGGEVVVDYAIRLKRLLDPRLFLAAYANDALGYIPSVRVLREGGYEGAFAQRVYGLPSTWSADLEEQIIGQVLQLVRSTGRSLPESGLD